MNANLILLIIKLNIIIESILLVSYLIAYYLVATSSIKNGLNRALSATFLSGALYTIVFLVYLLNAKSYSIMDDKLFMYTLIALGISRSIVLVSRTYLLHELREFVVRKRSLK